MTRDVLRPSPQFDDRRSWSVPSMLAGLLVIWWIGYALLFALRERMFRFVRPGYDVSWPEAIIAGQLEAGPAAMVVLAAFFVSSRVRLEGKGWTRLVATHFAIAACVVPVATLIPYVINHLTRPGPVPFVRTLVGYLPAWSVYYMLALGAAYGIRYFTLYRAEELRTARLAGQLGEARLHALNMQLRPHFLFNALNAVSALMHRDVAMANRVLVGLENLLSMTLRHTDGEEVPLSDELAIVAVYLEIEQIRFGGRLGVEWEVEDDVGQATVPQLLLQPLVENAIKHGIAPRRTGGIVRIAARKVDGHLEVEVLDDGIGAGQSQHPKPGRGIGLSNTKARLQLLYPDDHDIQYGCQPGGGFAVRIRLPLSTARYGHQTFRPESEEFLPT